MLLCIFFFLLSKVGTFQLYLKLVGANTEFMKIFSNYKLQTGRSVAVFGKHKAHQL